MRFAEMISRNKGHKMEARLFKWMLKVRFTWSYAIDMIDWGSQKKEGGVIQ